MADWLWYQNLTVTESGKGGKEGQIECESKQKEGQEGERGFACSLMRAMLAPVTS